MRQQQQHLDALVLGIEVFRAQFRIVQHLGADLGAADEVGHLHDFGEREAARCCAVQEPGDVGLAGPGKVVVLLHRTHLRAGETLDDDAAAGILFQPVGPLDQPLRHGVLIADEIGELELDRLRDGNTGLQHERGGHRSCV